MGKSKSLTRRGFIGTATATAASLTILPSKVVGGLGHQSPSDKLRIAGIGVGGKGQVNLRNMNSENIVALCDIDWNYASKTFGQYPAAKRYKDYRIMLGEMNKDIDAVVIATPDHTHAVTALAAMQLGNLAVRLQGLRKKLKWDGDNMTFTNLSDEDKITVTNGIPGGEPKNIELNAKTFVAELLRTTYRQGWDLKI
jgi:hypothetical protein